MTRRALLDVLMSYSDVIARVEQQQAAIDSAAAGIVEIDDESRAQLQAVAPEVEELLKDLRESLAPFTAWES